MGIIYKTGIDDVSFVKMQFFHEKRFEIINEYNPWYPDVLTSEHIEHLKNCELKAGVQNPFFPRLPYTASIVEHELELQNLLASQKHHWLDYEKNLAKFACSSARQRETFVQRHHCPESTSVQFAKVLAEKYDVIARKRAEDMGAVRFEDAMEAATQAFW